jgi:hypothetical protein
MGLRTATGAKLAGRGQVAKAIGCRTEKARIGFFADRVSWRRVDAMRHFRALACFA